MAQESSTCLYVIEYQQQGQKTEPPDQLSSDQGLRLFGF